MDDDVSDLHPSVFLSDYVKDIKVASSLWMKESGMFPAFESWQDARLTGRAGIWGIHLFNERKRHSAKQSRKLVEKINL